MNQPETVTDKQESPRTRRKLQAVGTAALKHTPKRFQRMGEDIAIRRILRANAFDARLLNERSEVQKALELETEVWHEMNYGDLENYKKYLPQSRIFAAFDGEKCVGMNRLFAGAPEIPPFLESMPIDNPA